MSLTLRTALGCTEAIIADDGGLKRFYEVAELLSKEFQITFFKKQDDFDTIDWDFDFNKNKLTLHYNIYNGISIFPTRTKKAGKSENRTVVELANVLEGKLLGQAMSKTANN